MEEHLTPVLLGGDVGCYSLARAFYEAYGVTSYAFGQKELGAVRHSRFLSFTAVDGLNDPDLLCTLLLDFAQKTEGATRILLPCTDEYAELLMQNREKLESEYILPLPPSTALPLFDKANFYKLAAEWGIDVPETVTVTAPPSYRACRELAKKLGCPFVIKPSSSVAYWHHPFEGMEKVYIAHNANEAECIFSTIFASGYTEGVLAQRYIDGGDAAGYVLTLYFDRDGRAVMRSSARVLLEEHTPKGKGNYAALITAKIPPVADRLSEMLASIGYRGFANFDLRFDSRDGKFYVLELNLRLGRSNWFLTAARANPAELLCRDYILGEQIDAYDVEKDVLFRTVPYTVVRRYTAESGLVLQAERLHRTGRESCPWYSSDLSDIRRLFYVAAHMYRERKKFRRHLAPVRK